MIFSLDRLYFLAIVWLGMIVNASPVPEGSTASTDVTVWPAIAGIRDVPMTNLDERHDTNALRMARGLSPLAPSRLYDSKRKLVPRISPAPGATTSGTFAFETCANGFATPEQQIIRANNVQDAVDACAALWPTTPAFGINDVFFGEWRCSRSVTNVNPVPCQYNSIGIYRRRGNVPSKKRDIEEEEEL